MLLLVAACAPVNRMRGTPSSETQWPVTVQRANLAADSGNYGNAERILAAYSAENPRARQAHEIVFWRAMFKLDPRNITTGSIAEGVALLEKYLADTATVAYRSEAAIVRRLAITTQLLQGKGPTPALRDSTTGKSSSDAEVAALRAELARTNAELDRIKKRLANPNK